MTGTESVPPTMSGGEALMRAARANGVDTLFGLPGVQIYALFDAVKRLGVRSIVSRHEQGAAYMAMGYARALGRPAAFAVVPGPGVLNASAALCTAMGCNTPLLCLTGQVPSGFLGQGRGHLHELADQAGTLRSLIKDALHVARPADASRLVNQAFHTMQSGRPGPVAVEMCWDVMAAEWPDVHIQAGNSRIEQPEADPEQLDAAVAAMARAKAPLIMCGGGAQHASESVRALAETLQAPVTAMRSGRGVVAEDHPLGVSCVAARRLIDETDLLIGIGSRLELITMRWRNMMRHERRITDLPTLIRIDIDPEEMTRLEPDVALIADADAACRTLTNRLQGRANPDPGRLTRIASAKAASERAIQRVQPQVDYLKVIREVLPRNGIFVPEVSQMGFASYFGFPVYEPRTYLSEGYQGTLGFGFQTALGAKIACPERAVVSVTGDGGFLFGVQELATAVAHDIGLVTLVFNNNAFGNVRRDQIERYDGRISGALLHNPDFVQLAESFGVRGYRAQTPKALKPVLEGALEADQPALIEVPVDAASEASPWEFILG